MKYALKKIISLLLSVSTILFCIPVVHSQAEQETYIYGDVNADGVFNVADAVMLKQYILGMRKLVNLEAGDLCKDNIINVFDMCIMKRMLLETTGFKADITNVQWNADTRTVMADVTYEGISQGNGAWIGVIPSDTPHNELDADKTDIAYTYLSSFESGSFLGIKVPYGISGNYDLRIYSDDNGGRELACVTFFIDESNIDEPTIDGFKGKITNIQWNADTRTIMADVTYEKIPEGNGAWIGVVPSDTPHNELDADKTDVCYIYLFDFESGSFSGLKVPDGLSGNYDLRIYSSDKEDGEELDCVTFTIS